jgi:chemotaxis-related protein WspD
VNLPIEKASDSAATSPATVGTGLAEKPLETCWKRIGVYGDRTCGELKKFVHCRNCAVFSSAAQRLLDRPATEEHRREWTTHFGQLEKPIQPAKLSAVVFRLKTEWLALPTHAFQEVGERRPIHSLPHRRSGIVLGLVNVRGELLVCVALDRFLGLGHWEPLERARASYDRLLVANWQGERVVFPVDEVHGIHRFHAPDLREPPGGKSRPGYAQGVFIWQERPVGFLDPALLLPALHRSLA